MPRIIKQVQAEQDLLDIWLRDRGVRLLEYVAIVAHAFTTGSLTPCSEPDWVAIVSTG